MPYRVDHRHAIFIESQVYKKAQIAAISPSSSSSLNSSSNTSRIPTTELQFVFLTIYSTPLLNFSNMKFSTISLFISLFVPFIYAAALDPSSVHALEAREADNQTLYEDVVGYQLPDGTRKIDFYTNGALSGSAVETEAGGESTTLFPLDEISL
jgi:hypothetical protein